MKDDVLEKTQNVIGLGDCQLSLKRRPNAGLARGSEHKGDFVRFVSKAARFKARAAFALNAQDRLRADRG